MADAGRLYPDQNLAGPRCRDRQVTDFERGSEGRDDGGAHGVLLFL
jgi:hypothetical protein